MYTKYTKQVFNGQGLTRKDDCFHGLLKDWTADNTPQIYNSLADENILENSL